MSIVYSKTYDLQSLSHRRENFDHIMSDVCVIMSKNAAKIRHTATLADKHFKGAKLVHRYFFATPELVISSFQCLVFFTSSMHSLTHWEDNVKCIFLNKNIWVLLTISLKFIPNVQINNIPALIPIMARRYTGEKPLLETMIVKLFMHICFTRT